MKKAILPLAIAAALVPMSAMAELTVYGKINVAVQSADNGDGDGSITELRSNASRIGFKGSEEISDNFRAIYKVEFETQVDDGSKGGDKACFAQDVLDKDGVVIGQTVEKCIDLNNSQTISQRNIYGGLQHDQAGTVIAGKFDTPMKASQDKIDLFNDYEGDIGSVITNSDNRTSNQVQYSTPKAWGPVKATVSYVASEENSVEDGISSSVAFQNDMLYLALAYDQDVEAESVDVTRAVARVKLGDLQLGALYEDQDSDNSKRVDADGFVVSAMYKIGKKWAIKGQYGESDMKYLGAETYSAGFDYKLSKRSKVFAYYTAEEFKLRDDRDYAGVGMEVKF
jgi:predicted porin